MNNFFKNFTSNGFEISDLDVLSKEEVRKLSNIANKLFSKFKGNISKRSPFIEDYIPPNEGSEVILRFPQQSKEAFFIIEKLLNNKNIKTILSKFLGSKYKLRQIGLRRSLSGDPGMYLHQDGIGETNIGILLSDNEEGLGSTIFLPSSHLIKTSMKKWNIETHPSILKYLNFLMRPIKGKKGNVFFFFNRTWHGRSPNNSSRNFDVILMSFHPNCVDFEKDNWDSKFLASIRGTTFSKLINFKIDKKNKILEKVPFAMQIEGDNSLKIPNKNKLSLFSMIFILRLIFKVYRTLKFFKIRF
tara:strand:- start:3904 stop:4806 length:903 start_codon:yes stop_codon:yes gene_type:complete